MVKKKQFSSATSKLKKIILGGLLVFGVHSATNAHTENAGKPQTKTKTTAVKPNVRHGKTISLTQQTKANFDPIKINTMKDMEKLFDMSLNIIFAELILEEVPMVNAYDDQGKYKGTKNTLGTGSTFAPLDFSKYADTATKWYHLASNPKTFSNKTISHEDMLKLVIGWGKYRKLTQNPETKKFDKRKTVLARMFGYLQGCSLRPNEFAALFCAAYNNEGNIIKLCPFVHDNYKNPIACANKIMTWCQTGPANGGTKDRCEFEALVYLNVNGFCEAMMEMYACPRKTSGSSCINVSGVVAQTLTSKNYKTFSDDAKKKYTSVVYNNGIGPATICTKLKSYFKKNPLTLSTTNKGKSLQAQYEAAIVLYKQGDFKGALAKFLELEAKGALGCDLLNDIAITYQKLGQYNKCISYCQKILKTSEKKEYAKACYNAGIAYEKQGNYDKAITNYTMALKYYNDYGITSEDKSVDYKKIYNNAITRATEAKKQQSTQKTR